MENIIAVMPKLLKGVVITLQITSVSVFFGAVIGLFMALGKMSKKAVLRIPASIYVEFIRGTPLFVQILLFYFGVPNLIAQITGGSVRFEPLLAGMLVCSINSGAYVAEIFRAGIQSIEKGQMEAARSLGMTNHQAMKYIILPQAFKRILPPLGNEFIVLLKDTSILAVIGLTELTRMGQLHVAVTYQSFSTYIGVAFVYLAITFPFSRFVSKLERRLAGSDSSN